jgi:hypothetical protein
MRDILKDINEKVAIRLTLVFGTMGTTYIFMLYGFMPLMFPNYYDKIMYWSSTVQLWSLPLLMVGQNLLGRETERRAVDQYNMIKEELTEIRAIHQEMNELLCMLHLKIDGISNK